MLTSNEWIARIILTREKYNGMLDKLVSEGGSKKKVSFIILIIL